MTTTITSPIVSLTLWLLLLFSVVTWTIVVRKGWLQLQLARLNQQFHQNFWKAPDLVQAEALATPVSGPLARLARAGFDALQDIRNPEARTLLHSGNHHEVLENSLKQQIQKEQHQLESGLMVLASIGSTAPFVGLFGTVWGIMHALQAIGASGSASLGVVAGPIGEALITTAIGIATAVPAVLAYNYGVRRTRLYVAEMEDFAVSFLRVAARTAQHDGAQK